MDFGGKLLQRALAKLSVRTLVGQLKWTIENRRRYPVTVVGEAAAGKTLVGYALHSSKSYFLKRTPSTALLRQWEKVAEGTSFSTKREELSDDPARSAVVEILDAELQNGALLRFRFTAGEQILSVGETRAFVALKRVAPRGTLIVVVNPFLVDHTLAEKALFGYIASLSERGLGFIDAFQYAIYDLFGIEARDAIPHLPVRPRSQAATVAEAGKEGESNKPTDLRSHLDLAESVVLKVNESGHVEFSGCGEETGALLQKALTTLTKFLVTRARATAIHLQNWLSEGARRSLVIYTRDDLLQEIRGLDRANFELLSTKWIRDLKLNTDQQMHIGLLRTDWVRASTGIVLHRSPDPEGCAKITNWIHAHIEARLNGQAA